MKSYIAPQGLATLQAALPTMTDPPSVNLTGSQVGSMAGFVPTNLMLQAQGDLLVDRQAMATSVLWTKIVRDEVILSAALDRNLEFDAIGNILFFANNLPFLWLVSDVPFGKLKTNPISHFVGDKVYLSIVFRFPYIQNLLVFNPVSNLHAKFPNFQTMKDLTVPEHTQADQCFVEQNTLYYGNNSPVLAHRIDQLWLSTPMMNPIGPDFYRIDGGTTKTGI